MKEQCIKILNDLIDKYPDLSVCKNDISCAFDIICESYNKGGKLLLCGNGGSCADCEHISGELLKSFKLKRPVSDEKAAALKQIDGTDYISTHLEEGLAALPLVSFTSLITAFSNDSSPDMIYAQLVNVLASKGDTLLAISTSGNSKNVGMAVKTANALGVKTVGLSGKDGGVLKKLCDCCITVPADETYLIQEYHLPVYHALCAMLEEEFFGN